ncbi:SDR family NAD(P)-dependent oxidoreductase, partial [Streptomyces sp. NPDC020951]|uniref:SDR family NAD(P)-dependent oxidoreductase n=1 Tax=Streptomyces sp. NPDC020951 TaxID=3365104 RepID=UPI0037B26722
NLRERVLFEPVVRLLAGQGHLVFVESSPHPVLSMAVSESLDGSGVVVGSLRRGDGGAARVLTSLAEAYVAGASVDWSVLFAGTGACRVDLPTYAFQHQRYWPEAVISGGDAGGTSADATDAAFWDAVEREDLAEVAAVLDSTGGAAPDATAGADAWLPLLSAWRRERRSRTALDSWRYRTQWTPTQPTPGAGLSGTWLVVVPGGGAPVDGVRDALVAAGAGVEVLSVPVGLSRAGLAERLGPLPVLSGVVSLLAWGEGAAVLSTVTLVQALADVESAAPLWVVTRGAASVGAVDVVCAEQVQVWALGQVVGLEQPGTWGGLVDLPEVWDGRVASALVDVLAAGAGEDQVAVRSSGTFGRRLVRAALGAASAPGREWSPRGTVLITGGTGGVAGHVARWLAKEGAERLVLVSRSGAEAPGAGELAAELESLGAEVSVVACDVTDLEALSAVIGAMPAGQPLTAVFHAAGVTGYAQLADITREHLEDTFAAKTLGARHLDELTAGLDLDAFVLFSSGAAVWGSSGAGAYAAANGFLDGLAAERRARGLVATSVSWGNWKATGMAEGDTAEQLARRGVRGMEPELAVQALRQAIEQDEVTLTVTDMDWELFTPGYTLARRRPLIEDIPEAARALRNAEEAADGPADESGGAAFRESLAGLTDAERLAQVLGLVREAAAQTLAHASTAEITAAKPFKDLGFDSLTAMDLRNRLGKTTGLRLPATLVFDYPDPQRLAAYLHVQLGTVDQGDIHDVLDIRRELTRIGEALDSVATDPRGREDIVDHLRDLLAKLGTAEQDTTTDLETATDDEIFDYIDRDLGVS